MESNWRWNVVKYGACGMNVYYPIIHPGQHDILLARFDSAPFLLLSNLSTSLNRVGVFEILSLATGPYMRPVPFSTGAAVGAFPYGFNVEDDHL